MSAIPDRIIVNNILDAECGICREGFASTEPQYTHFKGEKHSSRLHKKCFQTWLANNPTCPICRQPVDPNGLKSRIEIITHRALVDAACATGVGLTVPGLGMLMGASGLLTAETTSLDDVEVNLVQTAALAIAGIGLGHIVIRLVKPRVAVRAALAIELLRFAVLSEAGIAVGVGTVAALETAAIAARTEVGGAVAGLAKLALGIGTAVRVAGMRLLPGDGGILATGFRAGLLAGASTTAAIALGAGIALTRGVELLEPVNAAVEIAVSAVAAGGAVGAGATAAAAVGAMAHRIFDRLRVDAISRYNIGVGVGLSGVALLATSSIPISAMVAAATAGVLSLVPR